MPDDLIDPTARVVGGAPVPPLSVVEQAPNVMVYADLYFETGGMDVNETDAEKPQQLETGRSYLLTITLYQSSARGSQDIADGVDLHIELHDVGSISVDVRIPEPIRTTPLSQGRSVRREFELKIPVDAPFADGKLLVKTKGAKREPKTLRERAIRINSEVFAPPPPLIRDSLVALNAVEPSTRALLYFEESQRKITATGFHSVAGILLDTFEAQDFSLADADNDPSLKVYNAVVNYRNTRIPKLITWLKKVLAVTNGEVSLIISEHVDSLIPWEMIRLDNETPPLGARIVVTRWTNVLLGDEQTKLPPDECAKKTGLVLNYVHPQWKHSEDESKQLRLCDEIECKNEEELLAHLHKPPPEFALLFLSCHGTFTADENHRTAVSAASFGKREISPLELGDLPKIPQEPMVVVNACHSARVSRTDFGLLGLPIIFLSRYSKTFLGTLGAVSQIYAARFGSQLIQEARDGVLDLPQFMLRKRREAWEQFNNAAVGNRNYYDFVSAFLYVLYGPLQAPVRLLPKKVAGGAGHD